MMHAEPRQKILLTLGEGACYLLSLIRLAEDLLGKYIDVVPVFRDCITMGFVREDCYILDPAAIMHLLYGGKWTWWKEDADYEPKDGEFEILRFERSTPARIYSHFVLGDGQSGVGYDPLGDSQTVAHGELQSKRILRLVEGDR